jgi:hypothetical protein
MPVVFRRLRVCMAIHGRWVRGWEGCLIDGNEHCGTPASLDKKTP